MAITSTTLATAMTATSLTCRVTAATGATVGGFLKIDDEYMFITAITGTVIDVRGRGSYGTVAKAHNKLAPISVGLVTDVPTPSAGIGTGARWTPRDVVSYGVAGVIALPVRDTVVLLTGAAAIAMTLANPSGVPDGTILTITATTPVAHTVTLITGYLGANTSDVFTWPNAGGVGHSVMLVAYKGVWGHLSTGLLADDATAAVAVG